MEKQNEEFEIDLLGLFFFLKKKIWIIAAALLLSAVVGFTVSRFVMTPVYTASTRIYVLNRSSDANVAYSDFQTSSQILSDYKVLITGQNVTKEVIQKLNLSMSPDALAKKITVSVPDNTRVLQIDVIDESPQEAADIANAVREVASEQIVEIVNVDAVSLVYEADVPEVPSEPSVKRNTVLAGVAGFFLAVCVLSAYFILDDSIRTEEDVERYLGLSVLGVIPVAHELESVSKPAAKKSGTNRSAGKRQMNDRK